MKHLLILCIACMMSLNIQAQHVTHTFQQTSLSDALVWLDHAQEEYKINFIYDELEDFSVTTSFKNKNVVDALHEIIGFYPMRIVFDNHEIFVECLQKQDTKLIGRVIDEQGRPIVFANISLLSTTDSCFITGGVSNENGDFVIPTEARRVIARISFVGYKTLYRTFNVGNVGTIRMHTETMVINNVVVKGEVPKAQLKGNALIMNIEHTILAQLGTAEDILARIPTVVKRGEGFEVLGRGKPLIYINGRKMRDIQELRNLQSDQIRNVEVIQNPGARYDATVNAVIIIHTKRPQGEGLGVNINSYTRKSEGGINNERINLTWRKNGLELFAMGFGAYNDIRTHGEFDETTYSDTLWTNHHEERFRKHNTYWQGKVGFNYQPNDHHSLGAFFQQEHDRVNNHTTAIDELWADNQYYDGLNQDMKEHVRWNPDQLMNVYYNGTVGRMTIDFNTDYIRDKGITTSSNGEQSKAFEDRNVNNENQSKTHMLAEKLVIEYPIGKGNLSLGEEITTTRRTNVFMNREGYLPNSENETREKNLAPFMEISQQWGKIQCQAGLRYEYTVADYYFGQERQKQSLSFHHLFPSLALSIPLPLGKERGEIPLSLSYATRTCRPTYQMLNSNIIYENRLNYQTGNPMLKPSTIHNLSMMAMYKSLLLSVTYSRYVDDLFFITTFYNNDPKVNLVTYTNYPHRDQLMVTLGYNKSITIGRMKWMPQWNLSLMKQWFRCEFLEERMSFNRPIGVAKLNNAVSMPHDWLASLDFMGFTTGHQSNVYFHTPKSMLSLSLGKDFMHKRLNVKIAVNDLFNNFSNRFTLYSNRMMFRKMETEDNRYATLTLRYRLNVTGSKYKGTGAGEAEKARL